MYQIPEYTNSNGACPSISGLNFYRADCITPLTIFENQGTLLSTISGGSYSAKLSNGSLP